MNECLRVWLARGLSPVNKNQVKIINDEFAKQLNSESAKSPVKKKRTMQRLYIYIYISMNVFDYKNKKKQIVYVLHTSKQTSKEHVELLLLSNTKNLHYVLIKDFNRFMTNTTKHHSKKKFC